MIKIHRDNRVIFWLLIGGLVLNILWSLRLELQAKATKTIVEEYHSRLNKNKDVLYALDYFGRTADEIHIGSNDQKFSIQYDKNLNGLSIKSPYSEIKMFNGGIRLQIGSGGKQSYVWLGGRNRFELKHDNSSFVIDNSGTIKMSIGASPFIEMYKSGNMFIGAGLSGGQYLSQINLDKSGNISIAAGLSGDLFLSKIEMYKSGNIFIGAGGSGTQYLSSIKMDVSGNKLDIVAAGDINIKSKKGVVKINGKKIQMIKEGSKS